MVHPSSRPTGRSMSRMSFIGAVLLMVLVAGCNSSCSPSSSTNRTTSSTTSTTTSPPGYVAPAPCIYPLPDDCRFWKPDIIAVAVALDANATDAAMLYTLVPQTLNTMFRLKVTPYTTGDANRARFLPAVVAFANSATVFVSDPQPTDAGLLMDIDAINAGIAKNTNQAGQPTGFIPVQGSTDWIVGASPDWYGVPAQAGGDQIHGSPDDPPMPTSPNATAMGAPPAGATGTSANVFVLDTAYRDPTQLPAAGTSAAFDSLKSVWNEINPQPLLPTDTKLAAQLVPPYEFDEEDPAIAAMSPAPPYSPRNYLPVDLRDHGVAISELIHWIAPNAKISLLRILNDYGVGDLQTLLVTLQQIAHTAPGGAIINLSLDYGPPIDCLNQYWQDVEANPTQAQNDAETYGTTGCKNGGASDLMAHDPRYLSIGTAIEELIQVDKDTVIAAAGNSSTSGGTENANMPAAYCGVVAVGALTAPGGSLAAFSNRPNSPCLALDATAHAHTASSTYSVSMGSPVYVSAVGVNVCSLHFQKILPFDEAAPANGLALWSGTSFATALVTGNIAVGSVSLPASGTFTLANQTTPCS
jgi:hypothetical protein